MSDSQPAVTAPAKGLSRINGEFWLGQIFTLIATVVGVYLAANSGFEKAIEFESLQSKRSAYLANLALHHELSANVAEVQSWVEEFQRDPQHNDMDMRADSYQLDTFLWQTMQEGDAIFEIPYHQIEAISVYYGDSDNLRTVMLSGNPFQAPKAAEKLARLNQQILNNFLPLQRSELQKTAQYLAERGIALD